MNIRPYRGGRTAKWPTNPGNFTTTAVAGAAGFRCHPRWARASLARPDFRKAERYPTRQRKEPINNACDQHPRYKLDSR
jgi:hypothetical protein